LFECHLGVTHWQTLGIISGQQAKAHHISSG
jgi:hypothetical protein